jgi:hypothetical protein
MTRSPSANANARLRAARLLIVALLGILLGAGSFAVVSAVTTPHRTTPRYDPPVLAGQVIPSYCSGGVYARRGDVIVLTSSPHCGEEGTVLAGVGVVGPWATDASCPYAGHHCHASDLNEVVLAPDRIPWGHLNLIDLGVGGYRTIAPETTPLACSDIAIGDAIETNGRDIYRTGTVGSKGQNLQPPDQDGAYFPCMIVSTLQVEGGDSGGIVLVRGIPAGVISRTFGGSLGFTPLAEGLAQLGLTLCTTPDCGLTPPAGATR